MRLAFCTWFLVSLFAFSAFAEVKKNRSRPKPPTISSQPPKTLTGTYAPKPIDPIPAEKLNALVPPVDTAAKRIINLRIHPIYFANMIFSKDTVAAGRLDLDVLLGEKIAIGPSLIYDHAEVWDDQSAASGSLRSKTETRLEVGILTSIYVLGKTNEGGLILRPHLYYVDADGEGSDASGAAQASTSKTFGVRGGSEILYQVMLPFGLNFEIGGGVTYYFQPYQVEYGPGLAATEPTRLSPTVSLGVGWAF